MKIYQIAVYMLIASIVVNGCLYSNSTTPDLKIKFQQTYENDVIDFVVPRGMGGIVCSMNTDELLVLSFDGTEIMRESYSAEIIAIDSSAQVLDKISVALSNNEVITYVIEDEISVKYDQTFDHQIKTIASLGRHSDEDMELVLLETGELYGYGLNYNRLLSENADEETAMDTPVLVAENITDLFQYCYITEDGRCFDIRMGEMSNSLPSGVTELQSYHCYPLLCTENTAYCIYSPFSEWKEEADYDPGYVSAYEAGIMYRLDNIWYYSGTLSAPRRGKGVPESKDAKIDLPEGYDYLILYEGLVGYDEHTIILYSV